MSDHLRHTRAFSALDSLLRKRKIIVNSSGMHSTRWVVGVGLGVFERFVIVLLNRKVAVVVVEKIP
jgi:hypothetical protein